MTAKLLLEDRYSPVHLFFVFHFSLYQTLFDWYIPLDHRRASSSWPEHWAGPASSETGIDHMEHYIMWLHIQHNTVTHRTHCPYLQLDQHAFTAHTSRAPQVVDVFIFLIQLPSAHCFFTGAVITFTYKLLTINTRSHHKPITRDRTHARISNTAVVHWRWLRGGGTHPLVQSCSLEVLCASWTRPEQGDCSCSCQWCSSWCRPRGRSPSGSPCSNFPSCSADVQEPAEKQQAVITVIARSLLDFWGQYWYLGGLVVGQHVYWHQYIYYKLISV